jgi:OTU domain-containing protein 6
VVKSLRRTVAGEIRARWDDEYAPFMLGEDGTMPDRDVYCDKVRDTSEWGGNAEIVALARTLHCPIIVTSKANERTFGEDEPGVPIHLTYLKHAFGGIGEHYNSTIRVADLVRPEP